MKQAYLLDRTRSRYANLYRWLLCVSATLALFEGAARGGLTWSDVLILVLIPTVAFSVLELFERREVAQKRDSPTRDSKDASD
jgi:hypothetical protein